jgi:hypothetical protein
MLSTRVGVGHRASLSLKQVQANTKSAQLDNPTAVATQVLCGSMMTPGPLLDSFLEAGGIPAVLRLLRKSTDLAVLVYTVILIGHLTCVAKRDGVRSGPSVDLADKFLQAGEWG